MNTMEIEQNNDVFESKRHGNILLVRIKRYHNFLFGGNGHNTDCPTLVDRLLYEPDIQFVFFLGHADQPDIDRYLGECKSWADIRVHFNKVFNLCSEFERLILQLIKMNKIFISILTGGMDFGTFSFSLACDYKIATDDFFVYPPNTKLGILLRDSGEFFLSRSMGPMKTIEYITSDKTHQAHQLLTLNLVDQVVPHNELTTGLLEMADTITSADRSKRLSKKYQHRHFEEYLEYKNKHFSKFLSERPYKTKND